MSNDGYYLALLTADNCPACKTLDLNAIGAELLKLGVSQTLLINFSYLSGDRIRSVKDIISGSEISQIPEAASLRPYAIAFPTCIAIPKTEWRRAVLERPGYAHPGSPEIFARSPGFNTDEVAFAECDTRRYALSPSSIEPRPTSLAEVASFFRGLPPFESGKRPATRTVSKSTRLRELRGGFKPAG